jgi:hypothetical protein
LPSSAEDQETEYNASIGPIAIPDGNVEAALQTAADLLVGFLIDEGQLKTETAP